MSINPVRAVLASAAIVVGLGICASLFFSDTTQLKMSPDKIEKKLATVAPVKRAYARRHDDPPGVTDHYILEHLRATFPQQISLGQTDIPVTILADAKAEVDPRLNGAAPIEFHASFQGQATLHYGAGGFVLDGYTTTKFIVPPTLKADGTLDEEATKDNTEMVRAMLEVPVGDILAAKIPRKVLPLEGVWKIREMWLTPDHTLVTVMINCNPARQVGYLLAAILVAIGLADLVFSAWMQLHSRHED